MTRWARGWDEGSSLGAATHGREGNYYNIYASLNMNIGRGMSLDARRVPCKHRQHATGCEGQRAPRPAREEATTSRRINPLSPKRDE